MNTYISEEADLKETEADSVLSVFQIDRTDNVATALCLVPKGSEAVILGEHPEGMDHIPAVEEIPSGHKIALRDISAGEDILKYGVVIGRAVQDIGKGSWVHLQVMRSLYDERSSHLDVKTGAPKDTVYE